MSGVARTFALTTPQLPRPLQALFANAYLLCRINDTIEDDPELSIEQKDFFAGRFVSIVTEQTDDEWFASELSDLLSESMLDSEKELVACTSAVIRIKRQFSPEQQAILERCVSIMSRGMVEFQRNATVEGLADISSYNRYCYSVAGIVGETLTELMCDHSDEIHRNREQLLPLGLSFGLGLQMVNILKDIWEDRSRSVCWLPRDLFLAHGVDLQNLDNRDSQVHQGFADGMSQLIALSNWHLLNAQHYIQLIPSHQAGYRRYCLWAAGMAIATLRKIYAQPDFTSGEQVKISRSTVRTIIVLTSVFSRFNGMLEMIFNYLRRDLPIAEPEGGLSSIAGLSRYRQDFE
ncbi:MAG: phytoene/squalene synthase family protein [Acidiferrobacterales bacterium]|nr:phytoene/squalene synthase family protein [Acidiferrobacterales bacterium]